MCHACLCTVERWKEASIPEGRTCKYNTERPYNLKQAPSDLCRSLIPMLFCYFIVLRFLHCLQRPVCTCWIKVPQNLIKYGRNTEGLSDSLKSFSELCHHRAIRNTHSVGVYSFTFTSYHYCC